MYVLDTNIVSLLDPRRRKQALGLIDWLRRNDRVLFLSTVTLFEIETGALKLRRESKHRRAGEIDVLRDGLLADFDKRMLAMDARVALAVARLNDSIRPVVIDWKDLIIAATARVHGLTVLTRNLRHFEPTGVPSLDPLARLPPDAR